MSKNIGSMIKEHRESKGITRNNLSSLSGIPASSIASYENGNRNPSSSALKSISEALDIPVLAFLPIGVNNESIDTLSQELQNYAEIINEEKLSLSIAYGNLKTNTIADRNVLNYIVSRPDNESNLKDPTISPNDINNSELNELLDFIKRQTILKLDEIEKRREIESRNRRNLRDYAHSMIHGYSIHLESTWSEPQARQHVVSMTEAIIEHIEDDLGSNATKKEIVDSLSEIVNKYEEKDLDWY